MSEPKDPTLRFYEHLHCTCDEAADHSHAIGREHPIRRGWVATEVKWFEGDWRVNAAKVVITYVQREATEALL